MTERIVVSGAGIGGLCAALALIQRGLDVMVCEQASELREVGAGVQLLSLAGDLLHEGVKDVLVHVDPLGADARLAGVGHTTPERSLGSLGQVGVLIDGSRRNLVVTGSSARAR